MESLRKGSALHRKKSLSALLAMAASGDPSLSKQDLLRMKQVRIARSQKVVSFDAIRNITQSINEGM